MHRIANLVLFLSSGCIALAGQIARSRPPVDYVSPNIGGIGQLLTATVPYVQRPYGMARLAPITTPGITDRYLAGKIYGFPAGPAVLMASTGPMSTKAADYASDFDHDFEIATPYYYLVDLQSSEVKAELTATSEAAYYRFTFPASDHAHLVLHMGDHSELSVVNDRTVEGSKASIGELPKARRRRANTFTSSSLCRSSNTRRGATRT